MCWSRHWTAASVQVSDPCCAGSTCRASDLIVAPAAVIGEEGGGELNAFLAGLLATRARHERARLMYVAATRARETLHLSAAPKMKSGGGPQAGPRPPLARPWAAGPAGLPGTGPPAPAR